MDILQRLQSQSGVKFEVRKMPWGRALKQMQSGQVDLMIGLALTPERAAFIDYLQPAYYQCRPAFYGKADKAANVRTYEDLRSLKVGYVLSSAYFEPFDSDTQLAKDGVPTEAQLMGMVQRGHLPLMIGTDCQVDYTLSQSPEAHLAKAPYQPPQPIVLYLGMSKRSPHQALKPQLAAALQQMVTSKEIETLARHYQP